MFGLKKSDQNKKLANIEKTAKPCAQKDAGYQEHTKQISRLDSNTLLVRSAAKINLTLSVGSKRSDGYHEFESLMSTITLYDDILIRPGSDSINLTCDDASMPVGNDNLVYQAASLFAGQSDSDAEIDIELIKRIPAGAGLGGGSSDAAGTLLGLNELWELDWPREELSKLAAMLGSDVGFFLYGPLGICSGRGEIVKPLDFVWDFWAVVIKPAISLSTAEVYKYYVPKESAFRSGTDKLAKILPGSKPSDIYSYLYNDLEAPALRISSELGSLKKKLQKVLGVPVQLSGSGSSMFALFDTEDQAKKALDKTGTFDKDLTCWLVKNNTW